MKKKLLKFVLLAILSIWASAIYAQFQFVTPYDYSGRPTVRVSPPDVISSKTIANILASLPEYRSLPIYNPRLLANGRPENISLSAASDVWVSFVYEGANFLNAVGYYTYPTNAPLNKAPVSSDIHIFFANANMGGSGGGMVPGDKVYLGKFSANTTIAFVMIADGFDDIKGIVTEGRYKLFSDSRFNPEPDSTKRKHTITLYDTLASKFLIGFEDTRRDQGSDEDFNDIVFYSTVTPIENVEHRDSIPILTNDGSISFSGNTGGLESKSLGDAVSRRVYNRAVNNQQGPLDYNKMPKANTAFIRAVFGLGSNTSLSLADIMPSKILDSGFTAYVSTANDLTSITNAVEVRSVDFIRNSECRAVAFATKTLNQMYDHTKAVCDRLKGAELLSMENFSLNGLNFVRYTLQQPTGNIEYAISFSIGKKAGRNSFSFQSNWLNKDYVPEDTLYNYQIWGATPYYGVDLTIDLLNKLNAIMPIQALNAGTDLPKTYIIAGKRESANLNLSINNTASASTGYFKIEEKLSEKSTTLNTRIIPVSVSSKSKTNITVPVSDSYEATISLFLNNKLEDVVFMADGSWNVDYNKNSTVVSSFNVVNDTSVRTTIANSDLPIFRNASVTATTSEYVTLYKLLKGGAAETDLTTFKTLKFTASATGANMRITLIKAGVTNWSDQFSYYLPLSTTAKEYSINLADFSSSTNKNSFNPKDITTVVFALEVANGKSTTIDASISKISFSKQMSSASTTIEIKDVQLYPNPSKGRFVASFKSDITALLSLKVIDAYSGKPMFSKSVNAVKGDNNVSVEMNQTIGTSIYILSIEGEGSKYQPKKLIIQQ